MVLHTGYGNRISVGILYLHHTGGLSLGTHSHFRAELVQKASWPAGELVLLGGESPAASTDMVCGSSDYKEAHKLQGTKTQSL
jgi:hypothetical protein